jgi:cell division protein FtsB
MRARNIKYLLVFAVLITIISFLLFNEFGIVKYLKLKKEIKEIEFRIKKAEEDIERMNAEIDSLKNSDVKIEKVAREEYHMLRENEEALEVKEKED